MASLLRLKRYETHPDVDAHELVRFGGIKKPAAHTAPARTRLGLQIWHCSTWSWRQLGPAEPQLPQRPVQWRSGEGQPFQLDGCGGCECDPVGRGGRSVGEYRDTDGVTRPAEAWGDTGAAAERALVTILSDRQTPVHSEISRSMRLSELSNLWLPKSKATVALVAGPTTATRTRTTESSHQPFRDYG